MASETSPWKLNLKSKDRRDTDEIFEVSKIHHIKKYLVVRAEAAYSAWNRDNVGSTPTNQTPKLIKIFRYGVVGNIGDC